MRTMDEKYADMRQFILMLADKHLPRGLPRHRGVHPNLCSVVAHCEDLDSDSTPQAASRRFQAMRADMASLAARAAVENDAWPCDVSPVSWRVDQAVIRGVDIAPEDQLAITPGGVCVRCLRAYDVQVDRFMFKFSVEFAINVKIKQ